MADFIKSKNKSKEHINKVENFPNLTSSKNEKLNFKLFDFIVLIFSFLSVVSDFCTDFILVIQYSYQGYKALAIATFILIFFPSLIVQFFSIRWHITDKSITLFHWICHIFMLGIIHRYLIILKTGYQAYKSKNAIHIEKVYLDQSDLCILHLFESFLESCPQLVLQVYVILTLKEWRFWTVLSAIGSLLSLSWALAAYSKTQRQARPNKKCCNSTGLFLQAVWSAGMLLARITTLVLGAYCFGNYIFLLVAIHWATMTVWIIHQKTDFCDSYWDEKIYNAVVGVIYCFCFFNLQEGQSRWRLLTFHLIIIFQNLSCLTIFLMYYGNSLPKLAVASFIAVVGGIVVGVTCMLVYYRFYHPSGPIKFSFALEGVKHQSDDYCSMTLRSLKQMRSEMQSNAVTNRASNSDVKEVLSPLSPTSDSVIIVEETNDEDVDSDIRTLREWINEINEKPSAKPPDPEVSETPLRKPERDEDFLKRRAICSTPHLVKLLGEKTETEVRGSPKLITLDEASSEVLSTHDYENVCAVNIAREVWGLRSWKGYLDIETWLHDDSVVNDGCLDTYTSTATFSEKSCSTTQKLNENTKQEDYEEIQGCESVQCEPEMNSFEPCSIDLLPVSYPLGTLDPIYEEVEEQLSTGSISSEEKSIKNNPVCSLVATIDEIRHNTPISSRYETPEKFQKDFILCRAVPRKLISN